MSKNAKNKYETVVATDNVPIFSADTQIQEDKASMQLVEDFYSGTLGRYMEYESNRYPCRLTERNGKTYGFFEITKSGRGVLVCYDGCYPYTSAKLTDIPEFRQMSLYRLLEANACYKGLEATAHYHGMKSSLPYESFKLSPHHFCNKPFQAGKEFVPLDEKASYESELQDVLKSWYWRRFPNNINSDVPTEPESHRSGWLAMVFDFKDQYGLTCMKVIKLYFMLTDHTFAKCYIPLTRWFCQDTNSDFITTVGLPNKQILMNWPEISRAEEVIICPTVEDALAFQREAPDDGNEAFTAIMCDRGHYDQVDFSPLKGKKVNIMISNSDGYSLAESYLNTVPLYEYLRDKEGIPDIGFIQRQVVYPSLQGVFDIDALVKVHRNQKPYVTEGSVVELSESEFAIMVEKARAEIARKREQSQDLPFWERSTEGVNVPAPQAHTSLADCMISRPYIVGGTTTVIESAPGMGKSCLATAWGGNIAGSNEPFLAARCLTRSTRPDGRSNKVVYLVHDTDGQAAINDHRKDFAGNIGENDANFIQRNMAGDGTNYSLPNNYNAFRKLLDDIRDNEGCRGQLPDVLFIDTLLAFTHGKAGNAFEVFAKLNKDYPDMAIVVIHHLNLNDKTYGGILATMGPRVIIKMYRTEDQKVADRQPTLHDPFTVEIAKFNTNKIPEDGESFTAKLDDKNHFVVIDPKRQIDTLRCLLIRAYGAKYGLSQVEIARIFGTTDRTIRNWLSGGKNN